MLGLMPTIVRLLAAEKDKEKIREDFLSLLTIIFISGIFLSSLLFCFSDFLALTFLKDTSASYFFKISSVLVCVTAIDNLASIYFVTFRKMGKYSFFIILKNFGEIILIGYLVLSGFGLFGAIMGMLIVGILTFLFMFYSIISQIGFKLPRFSNVRVYLRYGLPLTFNPVTMWLVTSSDRYIIGYFLGVSAVGIYSASYSLSATIRLFLGPVQLVLFPTISRLYDEKKIEEVKTYLKYSLKYFLMFAIPSAFGLSALGKPLIGILTTSEFISGSIVIPVIALSSVAFGVSQITIVITHLVKKTHITMLLLLISAILNIILNIILIPVIGILGAAIATLASYTLLSILTAIICFRWMAFDINVRFILKSIVASITMALVILRINPESIPQILLSIFTGILVYTLLIISLKGIEKKEFELLKGIMTEFTHTKYM